MRLSALIPCLALAAVLAGCTTPAPSRYYTLAPAPAATPSKSLPAAGAKYAISVRPVSVPTQVDRPQIVISRRDSDQVVPLNESLWASPLSDEIRRALSAGLTARLGVLDIEASSAPDALPVWKVYVSVRRFDSVFDSRAILDATWRLAPMHHAGKSPGICAARIVVPVGEGVPALVAGQRQAIDRLAALIAAQLSGDSLQSASASTVTLEGCT